MRACTSLSLQNSFNYGQRYEKNDNIMKKYYYLCISNNLLTHYDKFFACSGGPAFGLSHLW